jgi:hypothetical protein
MNQIAGTILPSVRCTLPPTNPTFPSVASLSISYTINGYLSFRLEEPLIRPRDTRYQIVRSLVSSDASVGSVIYDGAARQVDLTAPASTHYYFSRTYAGSYFGPFSPNTTGLAAATSGFNAGQIAPGAVTYVAMANSTTTQTFSKGAGAFFGQEIGRIDFTPQLDDATVIITANYRAGLGNIFTTNRIGVQFVTGVTSVFLSTTILPNGGSTTDLRPSTIQAQFTYTRSNSAYAQLYWDTTSGPNSVLVDQVSLQGEFIKR